MMTQLTAAELKDRARIISRRLRNPPGGIASSELDIVSEPMRRRQRVGRHGMKKKPARGTWAEYIEACRNTPLPAPLIDRAEHIALPTTSRISVTMIVRIVCEFYRISLVDVVSQRRTASVVGPRHVAMYLARHLTLRSLPEIGRMMGGRDHTTVLHAYEKIKAQIEKNVTLALDIGAIRARLESAVDKNLILGAPES